MTVKFRIVSKWRNNFVAIKEDGTMDRKKFTAIYTYHNEESKKAMWEGAANREESDIERATNYTFARCRCLNNWICDDDFFFLRVGSRRW